MKKILATLCLLVCPAVGSAQTIGTIGTSAVPSANDFATRAFQDPWDMSQRTDLGGFLNGVDDPKPGFTLPVSFTGGIFQGTTTNTNPTIYLLETGNPNAAKLGKIGTNYPITTTTYKYLTVRMKVATPSYLQLFWAANTIYDAPGEQPSRPVLTSAEWRTYLIDLSTLGLNPGQGGTVDWTASVVRSLRFDPTHAAPGEVVQIDWARLVSANAASCRTVNWTGPASVDLFVTDSAALNPTRVASNVTQNSASAGCTPTGTGYSYFAGALAPGTYRVGVGAVGAPTPLTVSTAAFTWVVNDIPTLTFTSPDPEGSSDDFATTILNNPWDMNATSDFDLMTNVTSPQITTLALETPGGVSLGSPQVFMGTSVSAAASGSVVGDPYLDPLFVTKRGFNNRIDTSRYRILTFEMGIPNMARDILNGSIARIVWRVAGETAENVSDDIIFDSRPNANVLNKIIVDMADRVTLPLEPGSPSGWVNGTSPKVGLDIFRVDPHEFSAPTPFFIKRIKLAALEKAASSYTIRWQYSDTQPGTVSLYYNTVNTASCTSGIPIGSPVTSSAGQAVWSVASPVTDGPYYVCASFTDGTNTNETYGKWPVIVQHTPTNNGPRLVLNRTDLNFGIVNRPNSSSPLVATSAQTVRVTEVGTPTNVCWVVDSAVPAQTTYTVTLSSGTNHVCGSGSFTIAVNPASNNFNVSGVGEATFTVREENPGQTSNSPQYVHAVHQVYSSTTAPAGLVDTPAAGAIVSGSIAVTGWAVDDVDITSIGIYRDAVAGEGPGPIFIGNATRVDDARPDIEAGNPLRPYNYRAGWGYLLLTNFLPGLGDGTYTLRIFANDVEGRHTLIGSPVITGANSASDTPFGAIDTPAQGEVIDAVATPTFANFGWVLVRGPHKASPGFNNGATVNVVIDGAVVGSPNSWGSREDLDALFPNPPFSGISKALGVFGFNPSLLTNGVHTIAWGVTATNGKSDGIGSRYFTVTGGAGLVLTDPAQSASVVSAPPALRPGPDLGRRENAVGVLAASGPKAVLGTEMQRIVVDASLQGAHRYDAYLVANGELRGLPIGASFDDSRGLLYWQPGVGYTGAYDFVVVRDGRDRLPVRVLLQPRTERATIKRGFAVHFATDVP